VQTIESAVGCWFESRGPPWERGAVDDSMTSAARYEPTSPAAGDSNSNSVNESTLASQPRSDMAKQGSLLCCRLSWAFSTGRNTAALPQVRSSFISTVAVTPKSCFITSTNNKKASDLVIG